MKKSFLEIKYLKKIYSDKNFIKSRGEFLKKYSNRKYSIRTFITKLLPRMNNLKILDIGCGDCSFVKKLIRIYPNNDYFCLDIVENKSCGKINSINYKIYDGYKLPKYKSKFNVIFCMHMLYHVSNINLFLNKLKRILDKNGTIIITSKSKFTIPKIDYIFRKIVKSFDNNFLKKHEFRDESHFCLENGNSILKKSFPAKDFNIKKYVLETQLIVKEKNELLNYIISTDRYRLYDKIKNKNLFSNYLKMWTNEINKYDIFLDKYVEVVYVITKK